jgi:hypothetical protein
MYLSLTRCHVYLTGHPSEGEKDKDKDKEEIMRDVNPKEVEKHLKGVQYPAKKEDLVNQAQKEGASKDIVDALRHMPGQTFDRPTDVARAIGEEDRGPRSRS